ncbi:MAG: transposase [Burkholderiales bacterium]|nr:transposase [Burkholderiales bacterium]
MQSTPQKRRTTYSFEFKKKAVELAKNARFIADVARKLKVPTANIFYWLKAEEEGRLVKLEKPKRRKPRHPGRRHKYKLEFRLAAVQRVKEIGSIAAVARELNVPDQTLHNWVEAEKAGKLEATISFSLEEIRALKVACLEQFHKLEAMHSKENKETMKHVISAKQKLSRFQT